MSTYQLHLTLAQSHSNDAVTSHLAAEEMKKKLIIFVWLGVAFLGGTAVGAIVQHLRAGYWHKILKSESFPFPDGEITLNHTAESIGMPFLDPETSVLTVKTGSGLPITVYKAKRMFQESRPHVQDVRIVGHQITWQDGINTYALTVSPIKTGAEPTAVGDGKPGPQP